MRYTAWVIFMKLCHLCANKFGSQVTARKSHNEICDAFSYSKHSGKVVSVQVSPSAINYR